MALLPINGRRVFTHKYFNAGTQMRKNMSQKIHHSQSCFSVFKTTESGTMVEPEVQLNEDDDKYEKFSLPPFATALVARFTQSRIMDFKPSLDGTVSMDGTTSTIRGSIDSSSSSSAECAAVVKGSEVCPTVHKEEKVEYSLAEFERKLVFGADSGNRLDEEIIEEMDNNVNDDFENDNGEEDNDSAISLNSLEKDDPDEWVAGNCRIVPKMGCFGLIQLDLCDLGEQEENASAQDNKIDQSSIVQPVGDLGPVEKEMLSMKYPEVSISRDEDEASEISEVTVGDSSTEDWQGISYPFSYIDDDDDDRDKLEQLLIVETETWEQGGKEHDEGFRSANGPTSSYFEASSPSLVDENESQNLSTTKSSFENDDDDDGDDEAST